jgi:hypothetical protein
MNWIENYILPLAAIVACIWVTTVALRNLGQFGSANDLKKESFFRTLTNFFGIIVLILLISARSKDIVNETYFYSLFTAIVVSLGIKMTTDYMKK